MDWNSMFSSIDWMGVLAAALSIVVIFILRRFVFGNENISPKTKQILRQVEGLIYTAYNYVEKQGMIGDITGSNEKAEQFIIKFGREYRERYGKDPTDETLAVAKDFVENLIYSVNYSRNIDIGTPKIETRPTVEISDGNSRAIEQIKASLAPNEKLVVVNTISSPNFPPWGVSGQLEIDPTEPKNTKGESE